MPGRDGTHEYSQFGPFLPGAQPDDVGIAVGDCAAAASSVAMTTATDQAGKKAISRGWFFWVCQ